MAHDVVQAASQPTPGASTATARSFLPGKWRFVPPVALVVLGVVGYATFRKVQAAVAESVAADLKAVLRADVEALEIWIRGRTEAARVIASDPGVEAATRELVAAREAHPDDRTALVECPSVKALADELDPRCAEHGFGGYALLAMDHVALACSQELLVGREIPDSEGYLARARDGASFLTRPLIPPAASLDGSEPKSIEPVMYAVTPVAGVDGKAVAVLGLRIDPEEDFTRILSVARYGDTGETYAFDDTGLMISQSRFDEDLLAAGLLREGESAVLTVAVRDPGVDLVRGGRAELPRSQQPLTRMAASAVKGGAGIDVEGYRDYRGVKVVGAWRWLPEHRFGIATEVDYAEAFHPLSVLRSCFLVLFGLLVLVSGVLLFAGRSIFVLQSRVRRAVRRAERLGQYTIEEKIGDGGMGEVYRATHVLLCRPTALKLLRPEKNSETDIRRFEREVRATSSLTHANTIAIYDYGHTPDGVFYYAMEYLEGIDLRKLVRMYGSLPPARVIHLLKQACGSLAEAHANGLIHRDIKPGNLIVCRRGGVDDVVKVLDFGLVKVVGGPSDVTMTQVGEITGTPLYLSPESIEAKVEVDGRSDLYSLGCTAYFLLTGEDVFQVESVVEAVAAHLTREPESPSRRVSGIPADLEAVVMSCLEKDPARRPQTAEELADRLDACKDAGGWTRAMARAWWAEHGPEPVLAERAPAPPITQSIVVAVDDRGKR